MRAMFERVLQFQHEYQQDHKELSFREATRISVTEVDGFLCIMFHGKPFGAAFHSFLSFISDQAIADVISSLSFHSPDNGANGTKNWDFTLLANNEVWFPKLRVFEVERTKPEDHNCSIIGKIYEEQGVLGRMLEKAPIIETFIAPSAPDYTFFLCDRPSLIELRVDVGYNHQNFLLNFAQSRCFPNLRVLDYSDFCSVQGLDDTELATPFIHYHQALYSPASNPLRQLILRNIRCSSNELRELKKLRPNMLFKIMHYSSEYL